MQGLIDTRTSDTARWLARAEVLLERYGIVSREAAYVEELPSGFSTLYQVLKTMEESGRVRRGYFVEGLTGSQFGHVGAVDRLRSSRTPADSDTMEEADIAILAAVDPANPFGSLLPWPDTPGETRPRRVPGAWLMTVRGKPCLYVSPGGRQLVTFEVDPDSDELTAAFRALHKLPKLGRRALLVIEKIDGQPVRQSPHQAALAASGFAQDYRGMTAVTQ